MIEQQLGSMTRERREEIMAQHGSGIRMMKRMIEEKSPKNMRYKKVGNVEEIGDWECEQYKLYYKDKFDDAEFWSTDFEAAGVSPDDLAVCEEIEKEFGNFGGSFTTFANLWNKEVKVPIEGFPVRVMLFDEGSKMMRVDVTEIRREDLDPKLFELPKDHDKVPLTGME